jgi:hypothetical protein
MGLDRRIRDAFDEEARSIEPEVASRLSAVETAARRGSGAPVGSLLLAALVLGAVLLVPLALSGGQAPSPRPSPTTSMPATASVAGTYVTELDAMDVEVPGVDVAGSWSMTLRLDGVIELVPPTTFTGSEAAGHSYAVDGGTFRTDLYRNDYCATLGRYTWTRTGDVLRLTSVEDTCAIRRAILGTMPWTREP